MNIGQIIYERRKERGLTLTSLQAESKVSAAFIARVEHGERYPSASVLLKIAKPLGFSKIQIFILAGYFEVEDIHYELARIKQEVLAEIVKFTQAISQILKIEE